MPVHECCWGSIPQCGVVPPTLVGTCGSGRERVSTTGSCRSSVGSNGGNSMSSAGVRGRIGSGAGSAGVGVRFGLTRVVFPGADDGRAGSARVGERFGLVRAVGMGAGGGVEGSGGGACCGSINGYGGSVRKRSERPSWYDPSSVVGNATRVGEIGAGGGAVVAGPSCGACSGLGARDLGDLSLDELLDDDVWLGGTTFVRDIRRLSVALASSH